MMADLKVSYPPNTSVVKISAGFEKIYKKICDSREKKASELSLKEIEFLKMQCRSENIQVSLISCQTLVRLAENGNTDINTILTLLISLLENVGCSQLPAITEGIISLSLLSNKRKIGSLAENEIYRCPYGLKAHQHPIIMLLQYPTVDMNDVINKMASICNHPDKQIRDNSFEYLRPVFLYTFCNPQPIPGTKSMWTFLLSLSSDSAARKIVEEVIIWSKLTNASSSLLTSIILIEAIEYYLDRKDNTQSIALGIYLAAVVTQLGRHGVDPRPSLQCLMKVLHSARDHTKNHYNVMLILLASSLRQLTPNYLADVLRCMLFIVVQENCGHEYILNMCIDPIIQWMGETTIFLAAEGLAMANQILQKVIGQNKNSEGRAEKNIIQTKRLAVGHIRYVHPDVAIAFDLAQLVESLEESDMKDIFMFVDTLNMESNKAFSKHVHLFLRGLFLSSDLFVDCWFKVYEILLKILKTNSDLAYECLMIYIFKLVRERNPEIQLELLRGLPNLSVAKENIPMILKTIRHLANDNPIDCMDLYLRLWRVEPRTYPFLIKLIATKPSQKNAGWDYEVAKAFIIREICKDNPKQYGPDLISHISDILNASPDLDGDLATSLALDSIVLLCDCQIVNIPSTWRVLRGRFSHETRRRSLNALYSFFSLFPQLYTPTDEFEEAINDALKELWLTISRSDSDPILIRNALAALKHYEPGATLHLRHISPIYTQNIPCIREFNSSGCEIIDLQQQQVPGECWVRLLQQIKPECGDAAADLISHHIHREIRGFRSGVYYVPEGKPEPRKLQGLFPQSVLRAVTSYLIQQSKMSDYMTEPNVVTNALRSISRKFSKPLPPLDWGFLHNFFQLSFEARKYCILILKNQMLHSKSAMLLMKIFLTDFEPNCFEEDLLLLFSILPDIANAIDLPTLKGFAEKVAVYSFKGSQLNGFQEGCLFEKFLDSVKGIFSAEYDYPEVLDLFTLIMERYLESMDDNSKLFERYTEVANMLDFNSVDNLTSPLNWWEVPWGKLRKATIIRCYLVLYNTKHSNPLKWLSPIIDIFVSRSEEDRQFFYRHLSATLYAFNNDEQACSWTLGIFIQIQALLAEAALKEKLDKMLFLLEIFVLAVDVFSGCAILQGNLDVVATQHEARLEIFPESMHILCDHVFWKDQEPKIHEFLYNLCKNAVIPAEYKTTFKSAVICSHNSPYFDHKGTWTKYVGMRE